MRMAERIERKLRTKLAPEALTVADRLFTVPEAPYAGTFF